MARQRITKAEQANLRMVQGGNRPPPGGTRGDAASERHV